MEKHLLSKSTFIRGSQCLKSLYLNKKRPFLRDRLPKERLLIFQRGHRVGELAHQLFPGGVNMSPGHPGAYKKAILNTEEKVRSGHPVIYEAAFQYEQVMVYLDILVHTATGWHAYEVKSSGGISDTYLLDAALQYFVIKGAGIDLKSISLVHIDKEYILQERIDPKSLFKIVDVTDEALSRQAFVEEQIRKEKETLQLPHSPPIDVGMHCRKPYDCDFTGHCWKNVSVPERKGIKDQFKQEALKGVKVNTEDTVFVKLLPMKPAVPLYMGTHPYQDIIYGYSITGSDMDTPKTLLFNPSTNPEKELAPALKAEIKGVSNIICFGHGPILARLFPDRNILDLRDMIHGDSDFYMEWKDKSELERLWALLESGKGNNHPEYLSDAIAEHHYLHEHEDEAVIERIMVYASSCVQSIQDLYHLTISL